MPPTLTIRSSEVEFSAILSQGPGGQNVNKVHTGVQLRFDIPASSLPEPVKARLLACADGRMRALRQNACYVHQARFSALRHDIPNRIL